MKSTVIPIALLLFVALASSLPAAEHNLPMFGELPNPGKNWTKKEDTGALEGRMRFSWTNFENTVSGDVLSFVAWEAPGAKVIGGAVQQASIETFDRHGYAHLSASSRDDPGSNIISDLIRHRNVSVDVRNHAADMQFEVEAIEYTYVFESDGKAASTIAHGYVVVMGDLVLFVRHTAKRIVTSDLAQTMLFDLVLRHYKRVSGIDTGWSFMLDQNPDRSQ